jgi:copper chaperone CopZ
MQYLSLVVLLAVAAWAAYRVLPRYLARRRRGPFVAPAAAIVSRVSTPAAPGPAPEVASVAETVARAFPLQGLPRGRDAAMALETTLKRLGGVTAAYVSPLTALAYVDFYANRVTEEQIEQAILGAGFQVDVPARRFDWRHVHGN